MSTLFVYQSVSLSVSACLSVCLSACLASIRMCSLELSMLTIYNDKVSHLCNSKKIQIITLRWGRFERIKEPSTSGDLHDGPLIKACDSTLLSPGSNPRSCGRGGKCSMLEEWLCNRYFQGISPVPPSQST